MTANLSGSGDRPRTVRAIVPDPVSGFRAVDELRAAGFPLDVSGAISGDVVIRIQAAPDRLDELAAIVERHGGRVEQKTRRPDVEPGAQGERERDRRFRNTRAPDQRGAIDGRSIPGSRDDERQDAD